MGDPETVPVDDPATQEGVPTDPVDDTPDETDTPDGDVTPAA